MKRQLVALGSMLMAVGVAGCGDMIEEGSGTLSVLLESEDTITDGLDPGDKVENIRDGWRIRYDKFIATVGDVEVQLSTDENVRAHNEDAFVVDLKTVPSSGLALWELPNLRAGRWQFSYATPGVAHGATRHDSVSQADFDRMEDADATYLVAGTLAKDDGQSCPPPSLAVPGSTAPASENAAGEPCYEN